MAKTKKRGGEKAHRKRVQARNNKIAGQKKKIQKMWNDQFIEQIEKLKNEGLPQLEIKPKDDVSISVGDVNLPNSDENTPLDIKL